MADRLLEAGRFLALVAVADRLLAGSSKLGRISSSSDSSFSRCISLRLRSKRVLVYTN